MYMDSVVNYYGRQNFGYGDLYPLFHGKKDFADISRLLIGDLKIDYAGLIWWWWWLFTKLCLTFCDPVVYSLPSSSVREIFQARILEWVAVAFSRGSS